MYTIVDIETTGNGIKGNKITEISIFKTDGEQILDEFTSLVNPECEIPYFITGLTGIDNFMVRNAPTLSEIAPQIEEITRDSIFVAHSVNFDYHVIKNEFALIGRAFVRKKLCTVRLARKAFPGFSSYSLGKLCSSLEIPITDRHRARGDAEATTTLFHKVLAQPDSDSLISYFLNARSQEATLPPGLSRETYERLPKKPGVYYFKDHKGEIIYVGKAKNIQKRVLGHFYDRSEKEMRLCRETTDISFELSGSDLLALLMESAAIKHHFPRYNQAQKRNTLPYGIFSYEDRNGIIHLAFERLSKVKRPIAVLRNSTECRLFLEELCKAYELCPRYCHLQENVRKCSHFRISSCRGICRDEETADAYNKRVSRAIKDYRRQQENLIIREKGRTADEKAVVCIQDGCYKGYGFVSREAVINSVEDLMAFIIPQKDTIEARQLIAAYLTRHPDKGLPMDLKQAQA
ncbi:exonuclease domain-containing protein [Lentiprolixibacter aurantiacus]|uniref:Exonuclease domain-containing protein n=1 Tax=Lentiprolixibacter aurantiacus TaxID=2993939 RepID=A0AAE3SPV2_9FLAO|nr:exonuclease domain-containing protein [Lentiprolixibacter aurantiacus]